MGLSKGGTFVPRRRAGKTRRRFLALLAGTSGGVLAGLCGFVQAEPGERKRKRRRERRRRGKRRQWSAGPALYPDLQTFVPSDLQFDQLDDGTHVLRFTNTVWNAGEGRLELEATRPKKRKKRRRAGRLYQNLYDAPVEGNRSARRRVRGRIIFHDDHGHYHFADFATYELLQCDAAGDCQPIGDSAKTSFCLVDSEQVERSLPRQYTVCELTEPQGITPGYGDRYAANLPDQWVVLPGGPLPDGEYAVRSTADPLELLTEGGGTREQNNAAITYFTVDESGEIIDERTVPER